MRPNLSKASSLRAFLGEEYKLRHQRNPNYSLRAYARDLGLSVSNLSDILKGRGGISRKLLQQIAPNLQLEDHETELTWSLIESEFARTALQRKAAKDRLKIQKKYHTANEIPLDTFKLVSEWQHMAILELAGIRSLKLTSDRVAERLGISHTKALESMNRLVDLGLLVRDGEVYSRGAELSVVGKNVPNAAIRDFHRQIISKAAVAIDEQDTHQRMLTSNIVAISASDYERAMGRIQKFIEEFLSEFGSSGDKKEKLYCLSGQFFSLDKTSTKVGLT
ncbi:MAG TPA: TIGR02147 family protein [Bdellovibrionales bacterium]|jgi:uncharacterized protein (TIGR02147 family)|nr:TIGR02147 family protein [Bdellovibrionales bacterium]